MGSKHVEYTLLASPCAECGRDAGERLSTKCRSCRNIYMNTWRERHPGRSAEIQRVYNAKIRAEFLAAYGGACACCGETTPEFLALDHIDGTGGQERRAAHRNGLNSRAGMSVYLDLRRRGWPKDNYRLLCHNCNCAKGFYGHCPHEQPVIGAQ